MPMKRSAIDLAAIADWRNLSAAFRAASRGKLARPEVQAFAADLDDQLARLGREIRAGEPRLGELRSFRIRDPKPRLIHAPSFRERVLHHAVIAQIGPVLDQALVFDTYACRIGKGTLAAARRCQHQARCHPVFAKIDIRHYFPSVDHEVLTGLLERRFKDRGVRRLLAAMIAGFEASPGKGLPIGALTSQHFANFYLSSADRFLLEECHVGGMVRYMDDIAWWCRTTSEAGELRSAVTEFLRTSLLLEAKVPGEIGLSCQGMSFCGFRILPGALKLSRRRRQRYSARRRYWEAHYARGRIDTATLQAGYGAALAITAHADAVSWRREQLRLVPLGAALADV
jgi:RNA-directed DNA polymerase